MTPWLPGVVSSYYRFVYERWMVYHRRHVLKMPPPWSGDPLLQKYRYTNVYRINDRGTQYLLNNILVMSEVEPIATLFNVLLYRKFNLPETYEALGGFQYTWDRDKALDILLKRAAEGKVNQSPAWLVNASGAEGVGDGFRLHCDRLLVYHEQCRDMVDELEEIKRTADDLPDAMARAHRLFQRLPGIGAFVAGEILLDINYKVPGALLGYGDEGEDAWTNPGPGCIAGIDLMTEEPLYKRQLYVDAIHELRDLQDTCQSLLSALPRRLTSCAVEFQLCEYRKYLNAAKGRHKRKYP